MALTLTRRLRPGGFLLFIIPLILLTIHYGYDAYLVDSCLEQGGSFNFELTQCSMTESFPHVPYFNRHWPKVIAAICLSLIGFVITTVGGSRTRSS